jgi:hypothetical protein
MTLAVDTELFAIGAVFAVLIAAVIVGYTLHLRSLCRQVARVQLDRSRALADARPEPAPDGGPQPAPTLATLAPLVRFSVAERLLVDRLRSDRLAAVAPDDSRPVTAGAGS